MWSHYVLSVAPIGKCPTMSQTSCGLEQLGRELICLANKKKKSDKKQKWSQTRMCNSCQCQLSSTLPSSKLSVCCALLSSPRPSQSSGSRLASLLACSPRTVILTPFLDLLSSFLFHLRTWAFPTCTSSKSISAPFWSEPVVISCLCSDLLSSPLSTVPSCLSYFFVFLWEKQA